MAGGGVAGIASKVGSGESTDIGSGATTSVGSGETIASSIGENVGSSSDSALATVSVPGVAGGSEGPIACGDDGRPWPPPPLLLFLFLFFLLPMIFLLSDNSSGVHNEYQREDSARPVVNNLWQGQQNDGYSVVKVTVNSETGLRICHYGSKSFQPQPTTVPVFPTFGRVYYGLKSVLLTTDRFT